MDLSMLSGGALLRLAAGQSYLGGLGAIQYQGVNATALTEIVNLSGKFAIQGLYISQATGMLTTGGHLKIVADGETLIDQAISVSSNITGILGDSSPTFRSLAGFIGVKQSFSVSFKRDGASNIAVNLVAFPLR